jgi:2-polyprenyl-3-methyl-5-hydroxy-6-metoxy-1,4-benzoquinol methylase
MDEKRLNEEGRELWNQKAKFWDELHGDRGNAFHQTLVSPAVERLLNLQAGERVLDVGCGNGVLARRLSELGGKVKAVDFSAELIELAKARGGEIDYGVVDATDEAALRELGEGQFEAIVCTMAMMDMPTLTPMFRAVKALLKTDGRFVFATMHPAFNSNNPVFVLERGDSNGQIYSNHTLKISEYLYLASSKGAGAPNEPNPHYYYHRPLHELLGEAFAAGLVMDGIEEPAFPRDESKMKGCISWDTLWQIPPVLAGRLR